MIDYKIRTDSKEHLFSLMKEHIKTEDGNTYISLSGISLDMGIPVVLKPAVMSEDGETLIKPTVFKDGYYTNIRVSADDADLIINDLLGSHMVDENTGRVWA